MMHTPLTEQIVGYERIYEDVCERFGGDNAFRFFNHHEQMVRQQIGDSLVTQMITALLSAKNGRLKSTRDMRYAQAIAYAEAATQAYGIPYITDEQELAGYLDIDLLRVADNAYLSDMTITNVGIQDKVLEAVKDYQVNGFKKEDEACDG